jgi:quinol monooxygenase YgiN
MKDYFLQGILVAKSGQRDNLAGILLEASRLMQTAKGCKLYVVGINEEDQDCVYVTEIWESKVDHENSLQVGGVSELIQKAIPLFAKQPEKGLELTLLS